MFVNGAVASTGQHEFRDSAAEQRRSLEFLHAYMLGNYRDLYAACLALDINDHNAALMIRGLLSSVGEAPAVVRRREGALIARRLEHMAPQRVYRLFRELAGLGVNNRRTRAIIRDWVTARPDPVFDAVKYRSGVKAATRHAHLPAPGEFTPLLFASPRRLGPFETPLFESWRQAHYSTSALYDLPYTVAEGFAARRGVRRVEFLERIEPRLTRLERLRLRSSAERLGVGSLGTDLSMMPPTRLASYVLSLPLDERALRHAELHTAMTLAARRAVGPAAGTWGDVTAVLDDSFSSFGSTAKRQRPLAVALACHYVFKALAASYTMSWTSGARDPLMVRPSGPTPLGDRLLDALEPAPQWVLVVSDGWDNAPPKLAAEVLRVWRERLDTAWSTSVVHLNPVYDATNFDVRRLAPNVPTVGIRNAEDAPALAELARFATGRIGIEELNRYLTTRQEQFLTGTKAAAW
ncbi:hypothetical protein [Embleya sp. NPDC001921]